jgi:hypothetical protein
MDSTKPIHRLSNVDLERRTATCSVCGDTKSYVGYDPRVNKCAPTCSNRVFAYNKLYRDRRREKRRLQPNWKPRHTVSQVDLETMTGICSICGLTKAYKRRVNHGKYTAYLCAVKECEYQRQRRRSRQSRIFHSSVVMVSLELEQMQTIDANKAERGCRLCGYNDDPEELQLHFSGLDESELVEEKLVSFTRKRLLHALKISEVYCGSCHLLLHSETETLHSNIPYHTVR